ncbi:hypothetical protein FKM82_011048 [Ascaphus truei]
MEPVDVPYIWIGEAPSSYFSQVPVAAYVDESHTLLLSFSPIGFYYRKCRLVSKTDVNHNTKLFCFELPQGCRLQVPVGHHVYLKLTISGDYILVSNPQGDFRKTQTEAVEDIFLLAAGTGLTPMIKLLTHVLNSVYSLRRAKLIFFNKTEGDILWREQVEQLCLVDKRFEAQFVLSEPSDTWTEYQGHISLPFLSETITRSGKESKMLICICGPNGFVDQGIR